MSSLKYRHQARKLLNILILNLFCLPAFWIDSIMPLSYTLSHKRDRKITAIADVGFFIFLKKM